MKRYMFFMAALAVVAFGSCQTKNRWIQLRLTQTTQ